MRNTSWTCSIAALPFLQAQDKFLSVILTKADFDLDDLFTYRASTAEAERLVEFVQLMCREKAGLHGIGVIRRSDALPLRGERLSVPLSDDGEQVTDFFIISIADYHNIGDGKRPDLSSAMKVVAWRI